MDFARDLKVAGNVVMGFWRVLTGFKGFNGV